MPKTTFNLSIYLIIVVSSIFTNGNALANGVLILGTPKEMPLIEKSVEIACRFYGIKCIFVSLDTKDKANDIKSYLNTKNPEAIVITSNSLKYLKHKFTLSELSDLHNGLPPILITGITPDIQTNILREWSLGNVLGCTEVAVRSKSSYYKFNSDRKISRELHGQKYYFPENKTPIHYVLNVTNSNLSTKLIELHDGEKKDFPVFCRIKKGKFNIFFLTIDVKNIRTGFEEKSFSLNQFINCSPFFIFIRLIFNDKCWHRPKDYANLTIDDPRLINPYGFLNYENLLKQMNNNNSHTTIAFIPWNYGRNEDDVVQLFKVYPNRFSICVHGNNHNYIEFDKYEKVPFYLHEQNIKQAVARMEKFSKINGIKYDRIMVFPHGISPAKTLNVLKSIISLQQ